MVQILLKWVSDLAACVLPELRRVSVTLSSVLLLSVLMLLMAWVATSLLMEAVVALEMYQRLSEQAQTL